MFTEQGCLRRLAQRFLPVVAGQVLPGQLLDALGKGGQGEPLRPGVDIIGRGPGHAHQQVQIAGRQHPRSLEVWRQLHDARDLDGVLGDLRVERGQRELKFDALQALAVANLAAERNPGLGGHHVALVKLADDFDLDIDVGGRVLDRLDDDPAQAADIVRINHFDDEIERRGHTGKMHGKRLAIDPAHRRAHGSAALAWMNENAVRLAQLLVGLAAQHQRGARGHVDARGCPRQGNRQVLEDLPFALEVLELAAGWRPLIEISRLLLIGHQLHQAGRRHDCDLLVRRVIVLAVDCETHRLLEIGKDARVFVGSFLLERLFAAHRVALVIDGDQVGHNQLAQAAGHGRLLDQGVQIGQRPPRRGDCFGRPLIGRAAIDPELDLVDGQGAPIFRKRPRLVAQQLPIQVGPAERPPALESILVRDDPLESAHAQGRRRSIAADAQIAAGRKVHQLQMGAARPDRVAQQDVALKPDGRRVAEPVQEVADAGPGDGAIGGAHQHKHPHRQDDEPQGVTPETPPGEDVPYRQPVDALGRVANRLVDHGLRVVVTLADAGIGHLDGGDEPVAELRRKAPLEDQGESARAKLPEQPGEHLARDHQDQPGHEASEDDGTEFLRQSLHPVDAEHLEETPVDGQADPEPERQVLADHGQAFQRDIGPDVAPQSLQRMRDAAL